MTFCPCLVNGAWKTLAKIKFQLMFWNPHTHISWICMFYKKYFWQYVGEEKHFWFSYSKLWQIMKWVRVTIVTEYNILHLMLYVIQHLNWGQNSYFACYYYIHHIIIFLDGVVKYFLLWNRYLSQKKIIYIFSLLKKKSVN